MSPDDVQPPSPMIELDLRKQDALKSFVRFVEKEIRRRSKSLLFDPHDEIFRQRFVSIATEVLEQVQVGRGLTDFIIQADAELNTNDVIDRNEFRARVGLIPTRAVEFIIIEFSVHRTGSNFGESTEF